MRRVLRETQVRQELASARAALRESEERYRRFVDEDLTGNVILDADGAILTCNPAFVRAFGFESAEEARTANLMSLLRNQERWGRAVQSGARARRGRAAGIGDAGIEWRAGLRGRAARGQLR